MFDADVAIVGAGPAGSACALSLRAHAPSLSIMLVEASRFDGPRIGETLPPPARRVLHHLGVLDAFLAMQPCEAWGTAAAWGAPSLHENDFLFHAQGEGWHVDRGAFDAMLARTAALRGVTLCEGVAVRQVLRGWRLSLTNGESIHARFLVDATGAATLATRACGAVANPVDDLVAFGRFFDDAPHDDPRTIVEAFESGWWYTASLPDARRFVACMTDADLDCANALRDAASWTRAALTMPVIGSIVARASRPGPVVRRAAGSRILDPVAGDGWIAIGDAASRVDPLSSQGITRAMRGAIFASYAIGDLLTRDDESGLHRYQTFVRAEFDAYLQTRATFYAREQRWPVAEFWRRRAGPSSGLRPPSPRTRGEGSRQILPLERPSPRTRGEGSLPFERAEGG
jgi:flavin-dependent dehydrogenase